MTTFENYYINFLNGHFSIDFASTCARCLGYVPHSVLERTMSQNSDLGPG